LRFYPYPRQRGSALPRGLREGWGSGKSSKYCLLGPRVGHEKVGVGKRPNGGSGSSHTNIIRGKAHAIRVSAQGKEIGYGHHSAKKLPFAKSETALTGPVEERGIQIQGGSKVLHQEPNDGFGDRSVRRERKQ